MGKSLQVLEETLQALLAERRAHEAAIGEIDGAFERMGVRIQTPDAIAPAALKVKGRRGRPPKAAAVAAVAAAPVAIEEKPKAKRGRRPKAAKAPRGERTEGPTGTEFVLGLIGQGKAIHSSEIQAAWKEDGRKGNVHSLLNRMVKLKSAKKEKNPDGRGSLFSAL